MIRHVCLLSLAFGLALAGVAHAEPPAAAADAQAAEARDAKWEGRLIEAQVRRDQAQQRVIASQAALNKARHREYPRGAALVGLRKELDEAKKQLAAAEAELPELLDEARLAGVSPAALQRFEAEDPPASD